MPLKNQEQVDLANRTEAAKARLKALRPEELPVFGKKLGEEALDTTGKNVSSPLISTTDRIMNTLPQA